ncbi:MAG: lipopolysaccharide biosynthesis protein [Colwellia sp.]|nr:lipopolysaccharide biosynthesis protein [Colwellia sp.]
MASKEFKQIIAMMSGASGAQIVTLLFSPVLTRIYLPDHFGQVGVFLALAAVLTPIAALSFPMAIVLAKDTQEAKQLSYLSLGIALVNTVVFSVVIALNIDLVAQWLNANDGKVYLYWVPVAMLFAAMLQITDNWVIRTQLFTLKAKVSVIHACVINFSKTVLGLSVPSALSLIIIAIINPLLNVLTLLVTVKNRLPTLKTMTASASGNWQALMGKYREFPLFQSPQALLNALSQGGPVVVLAALFGPAAAGYYGVSRSILGLPIMLLGKAVGDVFYGHIAYEVNNKNYQKVKLLFIQATSLLILIGGIPLGIVLLWGPELFLLVFGSGWEKAGIYAQYLSLWTFFILINSPSLKVIIVLKQQKIALALNMLSTPLRLTALLVGGFYYQSEWIALLGFVLVSIFHNIMIIVVAYLACIKAIPENTVND